MRIRCSSVGLGVLGAAALASGASAANTPASTASTAAISVAKRCYINKSKRSRAPMTVTGSGFTPGGTVQISSNDGSVKGETIASATGTIAFTGRAPDPPFTLPGQQTVTLTATASTAAITATTPVTVAPLAVGIQPSQAIPSQKVTWYFSGFDPGRLIFGHYLRTEQVALTRFGRAAGPCGVLRSRALLYPGGHPRYHLYGLQLDDARPYSRHSSPRLDTLIQFVLVSRPPAHPNG